MSKKYDYVAEGLNDRRFRSTPWVLLTGLFVVAGSILFASNRFTLVGVSENLIAQGGDIFLKYLFIVVAVERAAAVFVGMFRSQSQVDWSLRIKRINEILEKENPSIAVLKQVYTRERRLVTKLEQTKIIGKIGELPSSASKEDYLGFLMSTKHAYEFQKARFESVSNKYVARIVLVVGIFLAAIGLSILQDLIPNINLVTAMEAQIKSGALSKAGLAWQTGLLRLADVIVTGGLLGGGSAGLNAMTNRLTDFLNK